MDNLRVIGGRLSAKMEFCYSDGFPLNGLEMNGMQSTLFDIPLRIEGFFFV